MGADSFDGEVAPVQEALKNLSNATSGLPDFVGISACFWP